MKKAKIYKPAKTAMQSGLRNSKNWLLEFDTNDKGVNIFVGILFLFLIIFFKNSLNLKNDYPKIDKLFFLGIVSYIIITVLNFYDSLGYPNEEHLNLIKYPPDSLGHGIIKFRIVCIPFVILLLISIFVSCISFTVIDTSCKWYNLFDIWY